MLKYDIYIKSKSSKLKYLGELGHLTLFNICHILEQLSSKEAYKYMNLFIMKC